MVQFEPIIQFLSSQPFFSLSLSLFTPWEFFTSVLADGFSLESPQVSRILLSILAILNNVVVWMVFTHPLTFKSSSPFNNPLMIVPKVPIIIGIIATFTFHSFFLFPSEVEVLILLFTFSQFHSVVSRYS